MRFHLAIVRYFLSTFYSIAVSCTVRYKYMELSDKTILILYVSRLNSNRILLLCVMFPVDAVNARDQTEAVKFLKPSAAPASCFELV